MIAPWWSRYLLFPVVAATPSALLVLWFNLHEGVPAADYSLGSQKPWLQFGGAVWAGLVLLTQSALNTVAEQNVTELRKGREDLASLIGYLRLVVGKKSQRFHQTYKKLGTEKPDPGALFLKITQPGVQIEQIVEAIWSFYGRNIEANSERVKVSLMQWNAARGHLTFYYHHPPFDSPTAPESLFRDSNTVAGKAYFEGHIVVCEDVQKGGEYQAFGDNGPGSMFAYPVKDDLSGKTTFVINVVSTRPRRFLRKHADELKYQMEVFGDRLVLESQLLDLKQRVERG